MAPVEWIGPLLTAALVGVLIGGFLTARSAKAWRRAAHEEQLIEALILWLGARRNWRRASLALVRSCRTLAQEPRESKGFSRICHAARRAKKRWRLAGERLTLAEAAMETWRGDALSTLTEPPVQPTAAHVQRTALRGGAERIESLVRRFELVDQADLEWVRAERLHMRARRSLLSLATVWAQRIVWRIVRAWERPR